MVDMNERNPVNWLPGATSVKRAEGERVDRWIAPNSEGDRSWRRKKLITILEYVLYSSFAAPSQHRYSQGASCLGGADSIDSCSAKERPPVPRRGTKRQNLFFLCLPSCLSNKMPLM